MNSHEFRITKFFAVKSSERKWCASQIGLFAIEPELPERFVYKPELTSHDEGRGLVWANRAA